jgi:hypothetical protein
MDDQEKLFGLMAVAEDHQKAVKDVLDDLVKERAALAKERAKLAQALASVSGVAGDVRKAASEAVDASVKRSLVGAADTAAAALKEAAKLIIDSLSDVVSAADKAEGKLTGAVASFSWKWAAVAGGAAAGGIAAVLFAGWMSVWWARHRVEQLTEQRAALVGEVAQLQAQAEEWAKRGGRAKLDRCGERERLCVRVDKTVGFGKESDYFVLKGY